MSKYQSDLPFKVSVSSGRFESYWDQYEGKYTINTRKNTELKDECERLCASSSNIFPFVDSVEEARAALKAQLKDLDSVEPRRKPKKKAPKAKPKTKAKTAPKKAKKKAKKKKK